MLIQKLVFHEPRMDDNLQTRYISRVLQLEDIEAEPTLSDPQRRLAGSLRTILREYRNNRFAWEQSEEFVARIFDEIGGNA